MIRFLESHRELDRRNALFLNFDNLGAGNVIFTTGEGILLTLPCDREMIAAATEVSGARRAWQARPFVYKTLTTDNTAAVRLYERIGFRKAQVVYKAAEVAGA